MEFCKIKDVEPEEIDVLINLCVPPERRAFPSFVEGAAVKRNWARKSIEMFGSIAKIAYLNDYPAGLIQYQPRIEEKILEITCIFVPEMRNQQRGVGKALLKALVEDARKPKPYFGDASPLALVTWAFGVPGYYPQNMFYLKMGFKKAVENNPFLLYHPIKEGYVYQPKTGRYIPQPEDKGKALIFYDPSCPFCMYFTEQIKAAISEVAPNLPIRTVNMFEEQDEVNKRGQVPLCAVNGKPVTTFFLDKENFQREVIEALEGN
ncbi:GNAT family N-acetyltransferase [Candidatus Bathyarchaeota archaeon]|nr:GNAT family N-acetyltransferase [Candidatus Bathyarchaeota archaeon]